MILSLELMYYGDYRDMIGFCLNNFENASAKIQTYNEMPLAGVLGIKSRNWVWYGGLD